jgi:hypothetical protein
MFDEPDEAAVGPRVYPKDVLGHLLIVYAIEYIEHSPTRFTKEGQRADVTVVDVIDLDQVDPETNQIGLLCRRSWWRGARLNQALKNKAGSGVPLLARMGKGQATQGMPPYVLDSMTSDPQAVSRANAWFQANPNFKPSTAAPRWEDTSGPQDDVVDASFTPNTVGNTDSQLKYGPPPGHHEQLRQETTLEAMARRAAMPPATPPHHGQSEEIPF